MSDRSLTDNMAALMERAGAPPDAVREFVERHADALHRTRVALALYRTWVPKTDRRQRIAASQPEGVQFQTPTGGGRQ